MGRRTKRTTITHQVNNVLVLALSASSCTVRYVAGRMSQVEIALDGVQPPLVMTILEESERDDADDVRFALRDGTAEGDGITHITAGHAPGDLVREIGRYIARSSGVDPNAAEGLTR